MQKHDTAITSPRPSLPTKVAIFSEKQIITNQIANDNSIFDQIANVVDCKISLCVS